MDQRVVVKERPKFSAQITSDAFQRLITSTLRDQGKAQRFTAKIISAVATNPALQECEASTIVAGALLGESLDLSPAQQMGQYYLVPFKKKIKNDDGSWSQITNAAFVIGYKGMLQLAIRSGQYKSLDVRVVRKGEYLGCDPETGNPQFRFGEFNEAAPVIGYMAYLEYLNGFRKVIYWSKEQMLAHADQYSQAFRSADYQRYINNEIPQNEMYKYSSFWYKDFDSMACKTMLRQLISKWGVMSIEFQQAFEFDGREVNVNPAARVEGESIFSPGDGELNEFVAENKEQIKAQVSEAVGDSGNAEGSPKKIDMKSL
jgi:recombination protein RecT